MRFKTWTIVISIEQEISIQLQTFLCWLVSFAVRAASSGAWVFAAFRTHQRIWYSLTCVCANTHGGASRCVKRWVQLSILLALPSRAVVSESQLTLDVILGRAGTWCHLLRGFWRAGTLHLGSQHTTSGWPSLIFEIGLLCQARWKTGGCGWDQEQGECLCQDS